MRMIFLEPEQSRFSLGNSFKIIKAGIESDPEAGMRRTLEAMGLQEESASLARAFREIQTIRDESYRQNGGRRLDQAEPYRKTKAYKEIKESFLYGDIRVSEIHSDPQGRFGSAMSTEPWLRDVAKVILHRPVDPRALDESLAAACKQRDLSLEEPFRREAETLMAVLSSSRDAVAVAGPRLSGKTTLLDAVSSALGHEVHHFCSVAIDGGRNCDPYARRGFESFVNSLARGRGTRHRDVLIVLHGPLASEETAAFVVRLVRNRRVLLGSGHLMINVRKFRVAVELSEEDVEPLPPERRSWLDSFYVVRTCPLELPWRATLRSNMRRLGMPPVTADAGEEETRKVITEEIERHVDLFQECRAQLTGSDDLAELRHVNANNFLLLLRAADVYRSASVAQAREVLLFAALFCFSQDLNEEQRDRIERVARERLDCFNVPIQESLYEYFYDGSKYGQDANVLQAVNSSNNNSNGNNNNSNGNNNNNVADNSSN